MLGRQARRAGEGIGLDRLDSRTQRLRHQFDPERLPAAAAGGKHGHATGVETEAADPAGQVLGEGFEHRVQQKIKPLGIAVEMPAQVTAGRHFDA